MLESTEELAKPQFLLFSYNDRKLQSRKIKIFPVIIKHYDTKVYGKMAV
jgi:hypothetical protein